MKKTLPNRFGKRDRYRHSSRHHPRKVQGKLWRRRETRQGLQMRVRSPLRNTATCPCQHVIERHLQGKTHPPRRKRLRHLKLLSFPTLTQKPNLYRFSNILSRFVQVFYPSWSKLKWSARSTSNSKTRTFWRIINESTLIYTSSEWIINEKYVKKNKLKH